MIFGLDADGKKIKRAAAAAGIDRGKTEGWLRIYKRVKKNVPGTVNHYHLVRDAAARILSETGELEQILSQEGEITQDQLRRMSAITEDFRKTQPMLDYEFVISKADREFHSTLESVMRLVPEFCGGRGDRLLLQSEVENLLALTQEGIEKEKPDLFVLSCFYLEHSDRELEELSYSRRLERVQEIFEEVFREPGLDILTAVMEQGMQAEAAGTCPRAIQPVLQNTAGSPRERAESFLQGLVRV